MSDFFLDVNEGDQGASKKRRNSTLPNPKAKRAKKDESDDEDDKVGFDYSSSEENKGESSEEEQQETADEKRLRIAKSYLSARSKEEFNVGSERGDLSTKLQEEAQESQGKLVRDVTKHINFDKENRPKVTRVLRGHKLPPTCVAVTEDGTTAISGAKDCSVIQWDIETGKKLITRGGRKADPKQSATGQVLAVAISSDSKYFATGGQDKIVRIWDTRANSIIHCFTGHMDSVTCLKFRKNSYQLFSGSDDRSIKIWNLDPMMYTESLFGHQSSVTSIDCLIKERAISSGFDHTCRIWKVVEQTQLLYRGHSASIDSVSLINEETFVSGSQDGSLSLWHAGHKRPNFVFAKAHGSANPWVVSVAALPYSDLVTSGSHDGNLNFWEYSKTKQRLVRLGGVPMPGFINGISFPKSGKFVVAAVGQEHRLGRWWRDPTVKNSIQIVSIPTS